MKVFKKILLVIGILILIPFVIAIFLPTKYNVERSITIHQPKEEVFDYVKYLKNQNNYSQWAQMDLEMKKSYTGTDGRVGFISAWDSEDEDVGKGEQEIITIEEDEKITYEIRFKEPFESNDDAYMITEEINTSTTRVVWGFAGEFSYPTNFMLLFFDMEKELGGDLEVGLEKLKQILEE